MRLRRLRLEKYGCFDSAALEFAVEPGRITLVTAPNGAGKSVLRQAFHDLLFDIPLQSEMKFRYKYAGMALHAEAIAADGAAFHFGWVRGGKPPRVTDDEARYLALRAGTTPRQLEQLYALDTERLRRGGADLKGEKSLAGALLAGTGELARPRRVRAEIEDRKKLLWDPAKRSMKLNKALASLTEAGKRARGALQRPQHREAAEKALDTQRAAYAAARAARDAAEALSRRLHRIDRTRPLLVLLAEAEAWLAANPDAPALPAGLEQPLAEARTAMTQAATELALAEAGVADAEQAALGIERDAALAPHGPALARLPEQLGAAEKAGRDIGPVRAERASLHAQIGGVLREIGWNVPVAEAASLVPPLAVRVRARDVIGEHVKLRTACEQAALRLAEADARLARAEQVQSPAPPVPEGLAALWAEIHADRKPAQHAAEAAERDRLARARLRAALAAVPGWSGDADTLLALPVSAAGVFERLHAARERDEAAWRDAVAASAKLTAEHDQVRQDLAALRDRALPDDAAIAVVRARRDLGWRLIARRAFGGMPPDEAGEVAFAGSEALPLAFERAMRAADDLADQRIGELDRVQRAAALTRQIGELEAEVEASQSAAAQRSVQAQAAVAAWQAGVAPLGFDAAADMAEIRDFLAARRAVLDAWQAAEPAALALADVQAGHAAWAARLATLLAVPPAPLPGLLAAADRILTAARDAESGRVKWQTNLEAARAAQCEEAEARRRATEAQAAFEAGWRDMLAALNRPDGEDPAVTGAVLDRMAELDRLVREAARLDDRIDGMQAILDGFGATVAGLEAALAAAASADAFTGARALIARREQEARQHSAWDQAQRTLTEKRRTLDAARAAMRDAERRRDGVTAASGAADLDDAEARIVASRDHIRHAGYRDQALAGLREHGEGVDRLALQTEVEAIPAADMPTHRATIDDRKQQAAHALEAEAVKLSALQTAFDAGSEAEDVLDTAAAQQAAAAEYARLLDEHLVLHVAGAMLARAMDEVEADAGDGGVAQLSAVFGQMTNGAYRVAIDEADGTSLRAVEHAWPDERRDLDTLSEGTRDQLYLALRLMALREHAASGTPLPFIADDILQTFDDDRARSALGALVALSHDVQVIVLTHHAHLSVLADGFGAAVHRQSLTS